MVDVTQIIALRYVIGDFGVGCYTEGLSVLGYREIQVWHLDVESAGKLLNFVCNKVLNEKQNLKAEQVINDYGLVPFLIMDAISPYGEKAFQLIYDREHPAVRPGLLPPPNLVNAPISQNITCDHVRQYEDAKELG